MGALVRISKPVALLSTESAEESASVKKLLDAEAVPHKHVVYGGDAHAQRALETFSMMPFGLDFMEHTFTKFPLVIWREHYDDYERCLAVAQSVEELQSSNLLKHKDKIEKENK